MKLILFIYNLRKKDKYGRVTKMERNKEEN